MDAVYCWVMSLAAGVMCLPHAKDQIHGGEIHQSDTTATIQAPRHCGSSYNDATVGASLRSASNSASTTVAQRIDWSFAPAVELDLALTHPRACHAIGPVPQAAQVPWLDGPGKSNVHSKWHAYFP